MQKPPLNSLKHAPLINVQKPHFLPKMPPLLPHPPSPTTTTTTLLHHLLSLLHHHHHHHHKHNHYSPHHHLPPLLSLLVTTGLLPLPSTLRSLTSLLLLHPLHPSSLLLLPPLSSLYFSSSFLFNTLIRAYSSSRLPHLSLTAILGMLRSRVPPDHFTFPFVLRASASRGKPMEGAQVHCQVVNRGFGSDVYVVNNLISMFSAFGQMGSARKVFEWSIEVLDVVSWNSIIDGYVKAGDLLSARKLFDEMPVRSEVSWSSMVSGYVGKGELDVARGMFDRMPAVGRNVVTWNSLVSGFAKHGLVSMARRFFDDMPSRNLISWNAMVSGYALNGEMGSARELFDVMPEKDVVSWSSMILGYAQSGQYREALDLFKKMQMGERVKPNEVTMVGVLSACTHLAALDQGKWVHAYIDKNKLCLDDEDNLGAALIDMYAKCGCVDSTAEVFWKLEHKNVSAWNALINGFAVNGLASESLDIFEKMQLSLTKPNNVTFLGVLTACRHGGLVDEGRRVFKSMSEVFGIQPDIKHYGCIIDLLGRVGLLEEAEGFLRSMPMKPDVTILGALLSACRIHKNVRIADRLRDYVHEWMPRESGCHVLLSNIYATAGRWSDASEMRSIMRENGIRKQPGCSSVEIDGMIHEFVAGDHSHPQSLEINSWLEETSLKLRSEGYLPSTEDILLDISEEDKENWLFRHSEKLALAFAMCKSTPPSTIRIVKNLRICGDCHSFIRHVSRYYSREILVRDRIRFHHFREGSCSCKDFW